MPTLADLLGENQEELHRISINVRDVFLHKFPEVDHPKMFIVLGICEGKVLTCSVFINSRIPEFAQRKPELFALHVPIRKSKNPFLKYDSYACCDTPLPIQVNKIANWMTNGSRKIGELHIDDYTPVMTTLVDSGTLSEEEIEKFFPN